MHHSRCTSVNRSIDKAKTSVDVGIRLIDVSHQQLGALPSIVIEAKDIVEHLILDGNELTEHALKVPKFEHLQTLSLNANRIRNVGQLLKHLSVYCPKLRHLSLIANPGWPHPITNGDALIYSQYRQLAAQYLPRLAFLDSTAVIRPGRPRLRKSRTVADRLKAVKKER